MKPALYILAGAVGLPLFVASALAVIAGPFLLAEWLGLGFDGGILFALPMIGGGVGWCEYRDAQRRKLHQMADW